jgi:phage host-nuclease inhibitor protein Gam
VVSDRRITPLIVLGVVLAVGVVVKYGGESFFPGLAAGFIGTLVAFLLALTWDREREHRRLEREAADLKARRETELKRRLEPIRIELRKNESSLERLADAFVSTRERVTVDPASVSTPASLETDFRPVNPELLEGAWTANAARLSELTANYQLIADLGTTYGRIEELRWRLRYRTEHQSSSLDQMTAPLVDELRREIAGLQERLVEELQQPNVQPLGLIHVKS